MGVCGESTLGRKEYLTVNLKMLWYYLGRLALFRFRKFRLELPSYRQAIALEHIHKLHEANWI